MSYYPVNHVGEPAKIIEEGDHWYTDYSLANFDKDVEPAVIVDPS